MDANCIWNEKNGEYSKFDVVLSAYWRQNNVLVLKSKKGNRHILYWDWVAATNKLTDRARPCVRDRTIDRNANEMWKIEGALLCVSKCHFLCIIIVSFSLSLSFCYLPYVWCTHCTLLWSRYINFTHILVLRQSERHMNQSQSYVKCKSVRARFLSVLCLLGWPNSMQSIVEPIEVE